MFFFCNNFGHSHMFTFFTKVLLSEGSSLFESSQVHPFISSRSARVPGLCWTVMMAIFGVSVCYRLRPELCKSLAGQPWIRLSLETRGLRHPCHSPGKLLSPFLGSSLAFPLTRNRRSLSTADCCLRHCIL